MLYNYLKLALKVLGRNKFFTGVSLFGISFTLLVLMLLTALYDAEYGANAPLGNKDQLLLVQSVELRLMEPDTTWTYDTTMVSGQAQVDSSFVVSESSSSTSISTPCHSFLEKYLTPRPEDVEVYSFYSPNHNFNVFLGNRKLSLETIYTDVAYWEVFDFELLAGQTFNTGHLDNASRVAVITDEAARQYFGDEDGVVGKEIELGDFTYEVIGMVAAARATPDPITGDVFLPTSLQSTADMEGDGFMGSHYASYLLAEDANAALLVDELESRVAAIEMPNPERYNTAKVNVLTMDETYTGQQLNYDDPAAGLRQAKWVALLLLLFFVLLPTLNLINLNLSRIMEREAEIGVRKAFGAHSGTILYQFIFENVIITLIGGVIGMLMTALALYLINDAELLPQIVLEFNGRVFLLSLFISLLFGLLSGLLPAWRVSRLQIAETLKSNQL